MNQIDSRRRGRLRPLLLSFLLTLLGFSLLLSLLWIRVQAERGDFFESDRPSIELIAAPAPMLLLKTGGGAEEISLSRLNAAAGCFQRVERWVVPTGLRFSARAVLLTKNLAEKAHSDRLEREFYHNAGEV